MRLGLYRLFLSCLLFQRAIKREASFIVTVNKTISGRSSLVLGKISFQGSAYQRSWKVWKDCKGPRQHATFPPPSSHDGSLSLSPNPHYRVKSHALRPCHKINKSITFPHTSVHYITTWLPKHKRHFELWVFSNVAMVNLKEGDLEQEDTAVIPRLCFLCMQQVTKPFSTL